MLKEITYSELSNEALQQLSKGAFLNVEWEGVKNTMTIGWGSIGFMWGKPIFMVAVRYSRYTYELLKKSNEFTVSIPLNKQLNKELGLCGKISGRDMDKFDEGQLAYSEGQKVKAPILDACDLHYECKVVYKQAMEPGTIQSDIDDKFYSNNNFHVMFYGEIVGCYTNR
jgi:flavin reductase (DIM6/NTAB) family NADH-FMN oxidoreductase RutF